MFNIVKGDVPPPPARKKPAVDAVFLRRIKYLFTIILPGLKTVEALYIVFLTVLLLARTILSIRVAEVMGSSKHYKYLAHIFTNTSVLFILQVSMHLL